MNITHAIGIPEIRRKREKKNGEIRKYIAKYLEWGFNIVPGREHTKYPVEDWRKYQSEKYPREKLKEYVDKGNRNWMVICGAISHNLVVLDFDDPQLYKKYTEKIERRFMDTFIVRTGKKGYHIYYRTPEPMKSTKLGKIDILGEGKLAMLPPSVHPETSRTYIIWEDREPLKLKNEEWQHVFHVLRDITGADSKVNNTSKTEGKIEKITKVIVPYWKKGQRDRLEYALFGYLRKQGVSKDMADAILKKIINMTGDEEMGMRIDVLKRTYNLPVEELKGYVELKEILPKKELNRLEKYVKELSRKEDSGKNKAIIQRVPYISLDDDIYLAVYDENENYKFAHMDSEGNIELLDKVEINGITYVPRERGKLPIGYPTFDIVNAPDLNTEELVDLLKKHINKYVDMSEDDLEMSIFYILHTWFYRKSNTVAYLRFIGDTEKGKTRMLTVIGDLCFYPLMLGGGATRSAIMRVQELYHGTLVLNEADFSGDKENEMIKYINSGFERKNKYIVTNRNNHDIEVFDPFSPKIFAMRETFGDAATERRLLSISPYQTNRTDIPPVLPSNYDEEVIELRNIIARWTMKNWNKVNAENKEFINKLPVEHGLKQLAMPLSVIIPLFREEKIENKFNKWIINRQKQIIEDRRTSNEGIVFNAIVDLSKGEVDDLQDKYKVYLYNPNIDEDDYEYTEEDAGKPIVITTGMVGDVSGIKGKKLDKILQELGFKKEKRDIKIKDKWRHPHVILLKDPRRWVEDWYRYVSYENVGEIPNVLKDERIDYTLTPDSPVSPEKEYTEEELKTLNNKKKIFSLYVITWRIWRKWRK